MQVASQWIESNERKRNDTNMSRMLRDDKFMIIVMLVHMGPEPLGSELKCRQIENAVVVQQQQQQHRHEQCNVETREHT